MIDNVANSATLTVKRIDYRMLLSVCWKKPSKFSFNFEHQKICFMGVIQKIKDKKTLAKFCSTQSSLYNNNKTAILYKNTLITYSEFDKSSNQLANGLLNIGLLPEDRVFFLGKHNDFGYEMLFGSAKAKSVFVPVNWKLSTQEIVTIIDDSEAKVLFVDNSFSKVISEIKEKLTFQITIITYNKDNPDQCEYLQWRLKQSSKAPDLVYHNRDVVLQMYTSGTTGKPKGVQLSNDSFFELLDNMQSKYNDSWMNLNNNDIILLSVPFFHIGGLWWGIQGLLAGATNIIQETFIAWEALEIIEKYRVTKTAMVPAMIQFLLSEPNSGTTDVSSLKGLLYGGSPITSSLMEKAMRILDCDFYQIYGMTETGNMAVCLRPEDHTIVPNKRMKAAGKPLPGVELKVMTPDFKEITSNDEIGEIYIKSPSSMIGYWKREEATKSTLLKDGWIRTGDAGYIDKDGYLFICDRIKDMIICSGENIYPAEVETALSKHESIKDIAIIGIPDERWGEIAKAFIVLNDGCSLKKRELTNYARGIIAEYKIPQSIEILEALPRNSNGKVMKRTLREPYWKEKERLVN